MRPASLFSIAILTSASLAYASEPIDPTFGYNGGPYVYWTGVQDSESFSVAQDSRGHLISAGRTLNGVSNMFTARHSLYSPVSPDINFGPTANGIAANPFGTLTNNAAVAVAVDHLDRIIVASYFQLSRSCGIDPAHIITYFSASRFINNGSAQDGYPDPSFGKSGITGVAATMMGSCDHTYAPSAMVVGDNNEVIVGGDAWSGTAHEIAIAQWDPSGSLDPSFGTGGVVLQPYNETDTFVVGLARDSQGRILVAALVLTRPETTAALFRFDRSGTLDASFANAGVALIPNVLNLCCVAVDRLDRAIVAGASFTTETEQMFVARYTSDGKPDGNFGDRGFSQPIVGAASSYALGLTVDRHDRPIVVGNSAVLGFYSSATLVHFNVDGSLNTAVGSDGIFSTPIGLTSSSANSVLIDSLGRPTMSVVASDRAGDVPVLIRYDETFGDGFD